MLYCHGKSWKISPPWGYPWSDQTAHCWWPEAGGRTHTGNSASAQWVPAQLEASAAMPCRATGYFPETTTLTVCPTGPWWRRCTDVAPNNLGRNNRFTVGKNGQTKVIKIHYSIDSEQHNYKSQGRTLANEDTTICDTIHHVLLGLPLGNWAGCWEQWKSYTTC